MSLRSRLRGVLAWIDIIIPTENSRRVVHAETIAQRRATRFPVHQPKLTFRNFFLDLGWSLIDFMATGGDIGGCAQIGAQPQSTSYHFTPSPELIFQRVSVLYESCNRSTVRLS
jgi:hypothetical protein